MTNIQQPSSPSIWVKCLIALAVLAVLIPFALVGLYAGGLYQGSEFSPDDFSRRSFSYNLVPWVHWNLTKKTYEDSTGGFDQILISDGFIKTKSNSPKVWHLLSDYGSSRQGLASLDCDARFLTEYLDLTDEEGDYYWALWNEDFPIAAKIFWPQVADLARHEMYLKIPDVMQFAMTLESDGNTPFQENLDQLVAQCYLEMGILDLQLERYKRARARLTRSIEIRPSDEATQELAKCNQVFSPESDGAGE